MKKESENGKKKNGKVVGMLLSILFVACIGVAAVYLFKMKVKSNCEKAMDTAVEQNRKDVAEALNDRKVYLDILARFLSGEEDADNRLLDVVTMKESAEALEIGFYYDQDDYYTLSDGSRKDFTDTAMRDSIEGKAYSIMLVDVPEISNKTCLAIILPISQNGKTAGMVFGYFDVDEFIDIFSNPVYEDSGFSFLADTNGNVVVPARDFSTIDVNGTLKIEGEGNQEDLSILVNNIISSGVRKIEAEQGGVSKFIYGVPLEDYTDLVVIAVVDSDVIYQNVLKVTVGITGVSGLLGVLLLVQLIVMLCSERNRKKEVAEAVNVDELTGLATKTHHKEECEGILKKAKNAKFAYVVMDVSDFSAINATSGYEYGNAVLKNIADVLAAEVGKNECCSRTSSDHFAMLLGFDNQEKLVERIYNICEKAGNLSEEAEAKFGKYKKEKIIFNCGVYIIQSNNEDINRIRARANTARKNLKKAVVNQIGFYNDDDFRKDMENHELEQELLKAVENNELEVYMQPKYGAVSEKMSGAEALVRWNHPTKGLISPNLFIPLAESDGYVKVIDFFVFEAVCKKLSEWKQKGYREIVVSVNFSRVHLNDEDFIQKINEIVEKYGVSHSQLEIELTESADFNDMDKLLSVMYSIKDAGFGLAMDDFGSGYSSLQLLMKMPTGVLKMDKSLIDDCSKDNEADNLMAANIISLAKGRGHSVVAEGVETEEQKDILRDANCDMIQGYYYSKPITMDAFEVLLNE